MKPIGKILKTAEIEGKKWRQELQRFLLQYRSTPHQTTGVAPCELLFNRPIRGYLPELTKRKVVNKHAVAKNHLEKKKQENKEYYDQKKKVKESEIKEGDTVLCKQEKKNKLTPKFDPEHYKVKQRKHNTVIAERDGKIITRNVSYFKKVITDESEDEWSNGTTEQPQERPVEPQLRRSSRIRKPFQRFQYGNS